MDSNELLPEQLREMLKNRERAHLRLAAIQDITHDRIVEAMSTLSQLVVDPDPVFPGTCRFCGCTDDHACAIVVATEDPDEPMVVRCTWIDAGRTVCSNTNCIEKWRRLHPHAMEVQTSASRILTP